MDNKKSIRKIKSVQFFSGERKLIMMLKGAVSEE